MAISWEVGTTEKTDKPGAENHRIEDQRDGTAREEFPR